MGGVTDRLRVELEADARDVEVRGRSSLFDFLVGVARVLVRLFFGGTGEAEPADSISIMVSGEGGVFVFASFESAVTIGGTEATWVGDGSLSPPG